MIGGKVITETKISFFESMLHADVVRGRHSTGVYRSDVTGAIQIYKDAVPSPAYLEQEGWYNLRGANLTPHQVKTVVDAGLPEPQKQSNFYVGHNRYATMGAKTAQNAHPFQIGDVTLVHNGTLDNQGRLPDSTDFEVDSCNIAHAINKEGIDVTIQKLQGAFTLIWHDARDQTVNFVRNSKRPLYMVEFTDGTWAAASEKDMLLWLNSRRKAPFVIKQQFELPVGVQYVFDVSDNGFKLKETREHKLPTFPPTYSYGYSYGRNYYDDWPSASQSTTQRQATQTSEKDKLTPMSVAQISESRENHVNKVLMAAGMSADYRKDKVIDFFPYLFRPYSKSTVGKGALRGWTMDENHNYLEVEFHAMNESDFDKMPGNVKAVGQIVGAYAETSTNEQGEFTNYVAIIKDMEFIDLDAVASDDESFLPRTIDGESEEVTTLPDTREEILDMLTSDIPTLEDIIEDSDDLSLRICACCDTGLAGGRVFETGDDQYSCEECNDRYRLGGREVPTEFSETDTPDVDEEVQQTVVTTPTKEESYDMVVVQTPPVVNIPKHEVPSEKEGGDSAAEVFTKTLTSGLLVSKKEWEKELGFCTFCSDSLPWASAENAHILYNRQACCDKHYRELMG